MPEHSLKDRLDRERDFHDRLAEELDPAQMPPRPLSRLEHSMLDAAGAITGKRVLDLGCGIGDLTIPLAIAGARTTAIDLSAGMVEVARQRLEHFAPNSQTQFLVGPAEEMPIPDKSFDLIVGRFILHHLDVEQAARECARVLAPGGVAIFIENSGRNPLLMFAREHLAGRFGIPRFGTEDERPLSDGDVVDLRAHLPGLRLEFPVFDFFTVFDRQVLRCRWRPVSRRLGALDLWIWQKFPRVRKWSFRTLVISRSLAQSAG